MTTILFKTYERLKLYVFSVYSTFYWFSTFTKLYILFLINSSLYPPIFANVSSITMKIRQFQSFFLLLFFWCVFWLYYDSTLLCVWYFFCYNSMIRCIGIIWNGSIFSSAESAIISSYIPILSQCTLSLPPGNIRKPYGYGYRKGALGANGLRS